MKNKKLFIFREGEKSEDRLLWKPRGHSGADNYLYEWIFIYVQWTNT